jgi:hypothetical protein
MDEAGDGAQAVVGFLPLHSQRFSGSQGECAAGAHRPLLLQQLMSLHGDLHIRAIVAADGDPILRAVKRELCRSSDSSAASREQDDDAILAASADAIIPFVSLNHHHSVPVLVKVTHQLASFPAQPADHHVVFEKAAGAATGTVRGRARPMGRSSVGHHRRIKVLGWKLLMAICHANTSAANRLLQSHRFLTRLIVFKFQLHMLIAQ